MDFNCTVCKKSFDPESLIHFDGAEVCAECKPGYLQMIKEGVDSPVIEQKRSLFSRPSCPDCGEIVSRKEMSKWKNKNPCAGCGCHLERCLDRKLLLAFTVIILLTVSPIVVLLYLPQIGIPFFSFSESIIIGSICVIIGSGLALYYLTTYRPVKRVPEEDSN